jgi:hypothetical protein
METRYQWGISRLGFGSIFNDPANSNFQAAKLIEKAFALEPKWDLALKSLGLLEVVRGNFIRALDCFGKALTYSDTEGEMAQIFERVRFLNLML